MPAIQAPRQSYIAPTSPNDSIVPIDDEKKCTIALVGDWGTGQQPAKTVLQRIAQRKPDVVIHLGDIYYSGTTYEAQNYFLGMFENVFQTGGNNFDNNGTPRVFTMAGNHDMYAGGSGYNWLLSLETGNTRSIDQAVHAPGCAPRCDESRGSTGRAHQRLCRPYAKPSESP